MLQMLKNRGPIIQDLKTCDPSSTKELEDKILQADTEITEKIL